MIKVLIIEDELITASDLSNNLKKQFFKVTGIVRNMNQLIERQNQEPADVALVDLHLQDSKHNGLELGRFLKENYDCSLIFLTAYSEDYTFKIAKTLNPSAFLGKPFKINELVYHIELAYNNKIQILNDLKVASKTELFLPDGRDYQKVKFEDLILIRADKSYIDIFITDQSASKKVTMNIGHIEQVLPKELFFRISKSIIVNLKKIKKFNSEEIFMEGINEPQTLPKGKKGELLERLNVLKTP